MWISGALLLASSALAQPAAQKLTPNLESNIERPLRYRPDGADFVIENGAEFFNRPLYGGNTAFRVDGGDKPEFVLYLPGRGGNLRLALRSATGAKWLHDAASIVTRYLVEHGVIVEKTGLYSFFIMFTIGITKGRWNTLVSALQQFKDDYDKNQPLWRILPDFCKEHPRYKAIGLADLSQQIHDTYKKHDVARVTTEMYLSAMQPAMKPSDAFDMMAHREIDRVEIDQLEGRVTAVLLTPYPPGIPLLIPGERFNKTIVEYLKFARMFNEKFPGFDTDIHGLVEEANGNRKYYVDCVRGI